MKCLHQGSQNRDKGLEEPRVDKHLEEEGVDHPEGDKHVVCTEI